MRIEAGFNRIPVIDLARWRGTAVQRAVLADEVREICHRVGFLQVVNHGVEGRFIDSIFAMMERLFALPLESKKLIDKRQSRHFRGWEQIGSEYTNNRPDIREQVDVWSETQPRSPQITPAYLRLLGPNQWFSEDILPGYRDLTLEWFDRAGALASELLGILSVGLGLEQDNINGLFGDECMSLTKFIRYPPTPPGAAGVNAHHDTGFLTVLAPGSTPGLEIQNETGDWIGVPHLPGSLVINLGEMLQGMTGNYFVATPHRVITRDVRYAAGYFHGPSLNTTLSPLPLAPEFGQAVAASRRHLNAGFMARKHETEAGMKDMGSSHKPAVYGEQLWNYFVRSYPEIVEIHYPKSVTVG